MEQAQAGAGLQDVPGDHTIPHRTDTFSNGSVPEKRTAYSPSRQNGPSKRPRNAKAGKGVEDVAICASPAGFLTHRQKAQAAEKESIGGMLRKAMVDHQLGVSLNLILLVALTYLLFPSLRERVGAFFTLQYATGKTGEFSLGPRDMYLVVGYVVLFTGVRAACMDYALLPLAGVLGIKQKKAKVRYALSLNCVHGFTKLNSNSIAGSRSKHTFCSTTSFTGPGDLLSSSKIPPDRLRRPSLANSMTC